MNEVKIVPFEEKYTQQVVDLILPIQREEFNIDISIEDQPRCRSRRYPSFHKISVFYYILFLHDESK